MQLGHGQASSGVEGLRMHWREFAGLDAPSYEHSFNTQSSSNLL